MNSKDIATISVKDALAKKLRLKVGEMGSPFGPLSAAFLGRRLAALQFHDGGDPAEIVARQWPGLSVTNASRDMSGILPEILANDGASDGAGIVMIGSVFQCQVWRILMEITQGRVETYSGIAGRLGRPSAVRAVASAVAKNPIALVVPCHRVVPASGGVGDYRWGGERKKAILAAEASATLSPLQLHGRVSGHRERSDAARGA